jgi:predicted nucleotidyltransferase
MKHNEIEFPHKGRHSGMDWLESRTILYTQFGSRAYGTDHAESDYDYKGVCVPLQKYRKGFLHRFRQAEIKKPVDSTVYDIRKFFKLAVSCNPNILDVLWADDDAIVICTEAGEMLREAKVDFLSKKALYSFRGYAMSQLGRIRTHRHWLLEPPKRRPVRSDFGLPDEVPVPTDQLNAALARIQTKLDGWEIDFGEMDNAEKIYVQEKIRMYLAEVGIGSDEKFQAAGRLLGYTENFMHLLFQEKQFRQAVNNWKRYQEWKANRNPKRATLEAEFGYDCKHAMHLVRLMRMCREILTEGIVRVRRPDADDLKAILNGVWTYDQLLEWANFQDGDLIKVARESDLPRKPNVKKLDRLCQDIIGMFSEGTAR